MSGWSLPELDAIGDAEEVQVAVNRSDGSPGKFVIIWIARDGDGLYVRGARGRGTLWYKRVLENGEGVLRLPGNDYSVRYLPESDPGTNERISAEFTRKYWRELQWVAPLVTEDSVATTTKIVPM